MKFPSEQEARRHRSYHSLGTFIGCAKGDIEESIFARFEKIVRLYPDHTAIEIDHELVSYSQLNALANQLAHNLIDRFLFPKQSIGLLFEKGIKQIAAMIAVLKAGHFFVVIEPSLPETRVRSILDDCSTRFMITDLRNSASLIAEKACVLVCDTPDKDFPGENPDLAISPDDIAFVTHTSGSTGRPKAVLHTHRTFLPGVTERAQAVCCCPSDRVSNLSSGTANAVWDYFYALLTGATLVPFNAHQAGAAELRDYLQSKKITICNIASPLFRQLCEVLTTEDEFPDLRILRLRSEKVKKSDVDLYKKHFPRTAVMGNGLSSSECFVCTEYYLDGNTEIAGEDMPVGYPVPGREILLVDDSGAQVGFNEVGEIVVRSAYISPGYWRNPKLTVSKFKQDPEDPNKRLYFTGDLGLMLPDGCLIHKGRKDGRIKVRGYGVDLNEVEAVLRSHKAIRDAVVVDRKDKSGETRLIAYFTSPAERSLTTSELRKFLGNTLAEYMIPAAFVRMEALPLTVNGKIDHKALPEPDRRRPSLMAEYLSSRNEIQETLVAIWEDVLDIRPIGIHDNFFDLGGHSLSATQVVVRVIQTFELDIPLQSLFRSPTIAEMAGVIKKHQGKELSGKKVEQILTELESLSEDEARKRLSESSSTVKNK